MVVSAWGSFGPIVGASSTDSNRELGYPPEKQTLSPPNVGRDPINILKSIFKQHFQHVTFALCCWFLFSFFLRVSVSILRYCETQDLSRILDYIS